MGLARAAVWRPDAEALHAGDDRIANGIHLAYFFAGWGLVEADLQCVLRASPAKDVVAVVTEAQPIGNLSADSNIMLSKS